MNYQIKVCSSGIYLPEEQTFMDTFYAEIVVTLYYSSKLLAGPKNSKWILSCGIDHACNALNIVLIKGVGPQK